MKTHISSFYYFKALTVDELQSVESNLLSFDKKIRGLILIGTEGINATVCGELAQITKFKEQVKALFSPAVLFKDSVSDSPPFRDFKVRLREEIVTLGRPDLVP